MDYVIKIQGSYYYTNKFEEEGRLDPNFHDAILYKGIPKADIEHTAQQIFKNVRCFWEVCEYNEALKEYEQRIYVDPETKKYLWGLYIEVKDALKAIEKGTIVGCKYDDKLSIFEDGVVPDYISSESIIKGTWRTIIPVNKEETHDINGVYRRANSGLDTSMV